MAHGVNAPFGLTPLSSITGGDWSEKLNKYSIYAPDDGVATYDASIFTGDPVVFSPLIANAGTISLYNPDYADGAPSTFSALAILGVFQGCEYIDANGTLVRSQYWPASTRVLAGTQISAYVLDDPEVVFEIQVSTSTDAAANAFVSNPIFPNTNATLTLNGSFGSNFALNVGGGANFDTIAPANKYANNPAGGNTRSGRSAFYLDVQTNTGGDITHDYNKRLATLPLKAIGYSQNSENVPAAGLTMATTPFVIVKVMINNHVFKAGVSGTILA